MGILNALALTGVFFLAVPILIHLIHRQRYPRVRFSTLRFFDRTEKHNVIQERLIDIILLMLRMLALGLLVAALARPVFLIGSGARTTAVIVLDNSASMAATASARQSVFEIARKQALDVLSRLHEGDRAALVLTVPISAAAYTTDKADLRQAARDLQDSKMVLKTKTGPGTLLTPTTDTAAVLAAIDALPEKTEAMVVPVEPAAPVLTHNIEAVKNQLQAAQVVQRPGSLKKAVGSATGLLGESGDARSHLFVFSDFAGADLGEADLPDMRGVELHLVSLGDRAVKNVAIEDVTLARDAVHPGEPLKVTVHLRNYGKQETGPITLAVEMPDENPVVSTEQSIPAEKARSVDLYLSTFARENFKSGRITIDCPNDQYSPDNAFYFTIPIRPTVRVLCVNGVSAEQSTDRETFYLANALAPKAPGASMQAVSGIDVRTCELDKVADEILFQYDVIILANVEKLDKKMRDEFASFLRDGRSMLVFLGDQCQPGEYNGWGFLPCVLSESVPGKFVVLDKIDFDHPALRPFADPVYGDLRSFGAFGHVASEPEQGSRVLASFQNGDAALIEKQIGEGRIILATTSCHSSWSKWPLVPAFVPFVQRIVNYLATPGQGPGHFRSHWTGDSLLAAAEEEFRYGKAVAYRVASEQADGTLLPVTHERRTGGAVVRVMEADRPGNYIIVENPTGQAVEIGKIGLSVRQFGYSVNAERSESDLTPMSRDHLKELIPAGSDVTAAPLPEGWVAGDMVDRGGTELWWYLLLVVGVVLVAESVISWRVVSET